MGWLEDSSWHGVNGKKIELEISADVDSQTELRGCEFTMSFGSCITLKESKGEVKKNADFELALSEAGCTVAKFDNFSCDVAKLSVPIECTKPTSITVPT